MKSGIISDHLQKRLQPTTTDEPTEKNAFLNVWSRYGDKYNLLSEEMEKRGMNCELLDELLELRGELLKATLFNKINEMLRI